EPNVTIRLRIDSGCVALVAHPVSATEPTGRTRMVDEVFRFESHAYACFAGNYLVILDAQKDKYLCISRAGPVQSDRSDLAVAKSALSTEVQGLLRDSFEPLQAAGIVRRHTDGAPTWQPASPPPV